MPKDMSSPDLTTIKNLKINYIDIQNFKNIDYIHTELGDWNVVGGFNAEGKSSFVESIFAAISWNKFYGNGWAVRPTSLVKNDEDKAVIAVSLKGEDSEIIVNREFKKWTPKKPEGGTKLTAMIDWKKIDQKDIDTLLNSLAIDPIKIWTLPISKQLETVKEMLNIDTSEIDSKINKAVESRKESKSYKTHAQARYDDIVASWVPDKQERVDIAELIADKELFRKKEKKLEEYNNLSCEIKDIEQQIKDLEAKLADKELGLNIIMSEGKKLAEEMKARWLVTVETVNEKIASIEEINKKSEKYNEYIKIKWELEAATKDYEQENYTVWVLRSEKSEIISKSKLPEGLELSEDRGLIFRDTEYRLLNTATKIELWIDLVLASWSPLKVIRVEQGGEFDVKMLASVKEKILENDFQIFIERPIIDEYNSIVISDWNIVED